MIIIRGLNKAFGEKIIFSNFNLEIPDGSFVVISGDSGSGKSTLLNMIGGIEKPDSGITSLISQGITDNSLKYHLQSAKNNGITRTEAAEIITHISFYAGWPKAIQRSQRAHARRYRRVAVSGRCGLERGRAH